MSLKKKLEFESGVSCEYWKIIDFGTIQGQVAFILGGFIDQETKEAGKIPVNQISMTYPIEKFDINGNMRAQGYVEIKKSVPAPADAPNAGEETNFFVDAVDC